MNKKKISFVLCLTAGMIMAASSISGSGKINTNPKQQLPDPDTKPATIDKPVKPRYKALDKMGSRANAQKLAAKYQKRYEAQKRAKEQAAAL